MKDAIDRLLKERQMFVLRERRSVGRQPFVRPVTIVAARTGQKVAAFSRDISPHGIAVISKIAWKDSTLATLRIHSLLGDDVELESRVRWTDPFGLGWYVTGWHFLEAT